MSQMSQASGGSAETPCQRLQEQQSGNGNQKSVFSYEVVDDVLLPAVYRGQQKYIPLHMVKTTLLSKYMEVFVPALAAKRKCRLTRMTYTEALMLSEGAKKVCAERYENRPFSTSDVLIDLPGFLRYYDVIRDCAMPAPPDPAALPEGGWLQINNVVCPYVWRSYIRHVPLVILSLAMEAPLEAVSATNATAGEWPGGRRVSITANQLPPCPGMKPFELKFLNDLCARAGQNFRFDATTELLSLVDAKLAADVVVMDLPPDRSPFDYARFLDSTSADSMAAAKRNVKAEWERYRRVRLGEIPVAASHDTAAASAHASNLGFAARGSVPAGVGCPGKAGVSALGVDQSFSVTAFAMDVKPIITDSHAIAVPALSCGKTAAGPCANVPTASDANVPSFLARPYYQEKAATCDNLSDLLRDVSPTTGIPSEARALPETADHSKASPMPEKPPWHKMAAPSAAGINPPETAVQLKTASPSSCQPISPELRGSDRLHLTQRLIVHFPMLEPIVRERRRLSLDCEPDILRLIAWFVHVQRQLFDVLHQQARIIDGLQGEDEALLTECMTVVTDMLSSITFWLSRLPSIPPKAQSLLHDTLTSALLQKPVHSNLSFLLGGLFCTGTRAALENFTFLRNIVTLSLIAQGLQQQPPQAAYIIVDRCKYHLLGHVKAWAHVKPDANYGRQSKESWWAALANVYSQVYKEASVGASPVTSPGVQDESHEMSAFGGYSTAAGNTCTPSEMPQHAVLTQLLLQHSAATSTWGSAAETQEKSLRRRKTCEGIGKVSETRAASAPVDCRSPGAAAAAAASGDCGRQNACSSAPVELRKRKIAEASAATTPAFLPSGQNQRKLPNCDVAQVAGDTLLAVDRSNGRPAAGAAAQQPDRGMVCLRHLNGVLTPCVAKGPGTRWWVLVRDAAFAMFPRCTVDEFLLVLEDILHLPLTRATREDERLLSLARGGQPRAEDRGMDDSRMVMFDSLLDHVTQLCGYLDPGRMR